MVWHVGGKVLKSEQVPVMEILKEFRELAGVKGRNRHKATGAAAVQLQVQDGGRCRQSVGVQQSAQDVLTVSSKRC